MTGKSIIKDGLIIRLLVRVIQRYAKQLKKSSNITANQISANSVKLTKQYDASLNKSTHNKANLFVSPVEIYFCYPDTGEKINYRLFFEKRLENVENIISGQPIFLDRNHALRYSRFMGHAQSILKAYVEDSAIESSSQELYLKRGALNKEFIHGCYPVSQSGKRYVANPWFNQNRLSVIGYR